MSNSSRLLYEGSVKKVWEVAESADGSALDFEFTDAYSVFDWGQMPDLLPHKGQSLATIGEYFFKELEAKGIKTHFLSRPKPHVLRVHRAQVLGPEECELPSQMLYRYPVEKYAAMQRRLIPLEVVFRLGIPPGSSFTERLNPTYAKQLGLDRVPLEGERLSQPVVEFFSKLEDTDRFFTYEQALNYSGLSFEQFKKLIDLNLRTAEIVRNSFDRIGLELWDGKFEWILWEGEILLADSIGPDELRLVAPKDIATQLSKEFLRQYYRKTAWFAELQAAKKQAYTEGKTDWKERVKTEPPKLSPEFFEAASMLYPSIASALTGKEAAGALPIKQIIERIRTCLKNS